jgi:hypothetical protein
VLLPGDDPAEYQALLDELRDHFPCLDLTDDRFVREMANAEWRLRRIRQHQETLLTEACCEIAAADPTLDPIQVQARAYDHLLSKSSTLAVLLRYQTKFERQYDRAYRGWCAYVIQRQRQAVRSVSQPPPPQDSIAALPPEILKRYRHLLPPNMILPDEPNPPAQTPRNAPCPCGSGAKYKRCCGRNAAPVMS